MSANDVNIEDIMAEIRTEIKEKGYTSDMLSFKDVVSVSQTETEIFDKRKFTELMVMQEEAKMLPFSAVWEHYCETEGVPAGAEWFEEVKKYEAEVLSKRGQ